MNVQFDHPPCAVTDIRWNSPSKENTNMINEQQKHQSPVLPALMNVNVNFSPLVRDIMALEHQCLNLQLQLKLQNDDYLKYQHQQQQQPTIINDSSSNAPLATNDKDDTIRQLKLEIQELKKEKEKLLNQQEQEKSLVHDIIDKSYVDKLFAKYSIDYLTSLDFHTIENRKKELEKENENLSVVFSSSAMTF